MHTITIMEFEDLYEHIDHNIMYITENLPSQENEEKFNEQFISGCKCNDQCSIINKCACVFRSGAYYTRLSSQTEHDIYNAYVITTSDAEKPIYECNSSCKCHQLCGNRLVQFGPRKHLKIVSCESPQNTLVSCKRRKLNTNSKEYDRRQMDNTKGLGLITTENINKGNFICEYAGEVITKQEALNRHKVNEEQKFMNYIFCINEYFGGGKIDTFIDPSKFGNIGRYINHSCEPNCELKLIRVDNTIPKLCIFAAQDIDVNCELTFDYGSDTLWASTGASSDKSLIKCLCGADKCKQYMPFSKYLD